MADRKISDLTALTAPAAGDYLPIVDISEASAANKNKRITIEELLRGAPDGTAAAPSIGFESDPNTGIYSPGADQLAISTGGTGRLFVDSSGRLGLGTSIPAQPLDVNGNITTRANGYVRSVGTGSDTAGSGPNIGVNATDNSTYWIQQLNASNGLDFWYYNSGWSRRVTFDSSGRVGIGTTSPAGLIHGRSAAGAVGLLLDGNTGDSNTSPPVIDFRGTAAGGQGARIAALNTGAGYGRLDLAFYTSDTASDTYMPAERMRIDRLGRLLVGTSSGNYDFQVGATGSSGVAIDKAQNLIHGTFGTGGSLRLRAQLNATAGGGEIVLGGSTRADSDINAIVLKTSDVERIRVTSTGKTSISSIDNSFGQLQIGNTTSDGEVSIAFIPGVTAFGTAPTSTNGDSVIWVMGPNVFGVGATQFAIGNKGVGTYVAKLASNTATSWTFSSDERLKNIEGPVVAATQIIEAINPVYYSFKADSAATRKVGLIAQNVLSVLPEVVDVPEEEQDAEGKQQYMGLAMTDLVPVLIAALKESNLRIKELTDRVAALEAQ